MQTVVTNCWMLLRTYSRNAMNDDNKEWKNKFDWRISITNRNEIYHFTDASYEWFLHFIIHGSLQISLPFIMLSILAQTEHFFQLWSTVSRSRPFLARVVRSAQTTLPPVSSDYDWIVRRIPSAVPSQVPRKCDSTVTSLGKFRYHSSSDVSPVPSSSRGTIFKSWHFYFKSHFPMFFKFLFCIIRILVVRKWKTVIFQRNNS